MLLKHSLLKEAIYKIHGANPIFGPAADVVLSVAKLSVGIRRVVGKYRKCDRSHEARQQVSLKIHGNRVLKYQICIYEPYRCPKPTQTQQPLSLLGVIEHLHGLPLQVRKTATISQWTKIKKVVDKIVRPKGNEAQEDEDEGMEDEVLINQDCMASLHCFLVDNILEPDLHECLALLLGS